MSNYLTIATVSAALKLQLQEAAVASGISNARASLVRPDTKTTSDNQEKDLPKVGVNLFLYQVTPNATWRNVDAPRRRSDGTVMRTTRSAFDLHYLLSFYGDEHKFEPQIVLGSVLRTVQSQPLLTKERVRSAKMTFGSLAASNLDEEMELVKYSMTLLSLEELSKLWSVFFQVPYRLSISYQASVVFIDGQEQARPALPVRIRNVYVRPIEQPVIEKILSQKSVSDPVLEGEPIVAGETLVLAGKKLQGEVTRVRVGPIVTLPVDVTPTQIKVPLVAPDFAASLLRAGVQGVQVVHEIKMGTPETDHRGFESNITPFVLRPKVTPSVSGITVDGAFKKANLKLDMIPNVGVNQRLVVLLNEFDPPPPTTRSAYAYSYDVTLPVAPPDSVDTVTIPIRVRPATYLVRVQVDGAESVLEQDPDPNNPKFINPKVTI